MHLLVIQFTIKVFHIGFMQIVIAITYETNMHLLFIVQNWISIWKQHGLYTISLYHKKL